MPLRKKTFIDFVIKLLSNFKASAETYCHVIVLQSYYMPLRKKTFIDFVIKFLSNFKASAETYCHVIVLQSYYMPLSIFVKTTH